MIDRISRKIASELILSFMKGMITNQQFSSDFPIKSNDKALYNIHQVLWFYYDDISEYKLTDKNSLSREVNELFSRCYLFLESDLEYEWPDIQWIQWWGCFTLIFPPLLFYIQNINKHKVDEFNKVGDMSIWPFIRKEDCGEIFDVAK